MPILLLFVALTAASTPVASTELLYRSAPDFYHAQPDKTHSLLSKRLGYLLSKEYQCADGVICAIDANPWTDAQNGEILEPTFREVSHADTSSHIRMCYRLSLASTQLKQRCATIVVVRDATGHWLIDDLVSPSGISLQHTLESFDYGP